MNKLPNNLKIKIPPIDYWHTLMAVTDGSAYYKIVYEEDGYKTTEYYNEKGQVHRDDDKPAVIWGDGNKHWYQNGELHRDGDKHALIHTDGKKVHYRYGEKYDLPALKLQVKLSKNIVKNHLHDLATAKKVLKEDQDNLASYKKKYDAKAKKKQEASND